jgi:hypothetical protein
MKRDSIYGTALITGAAAGILTMLLHPTGHQLLTNVQGMSAVVMGVHALALTAQPILFFGALGLTRTLSGETEIPIAALVAYGFASVAVMCAAIMSGFVAPHVAAGLVEADPVNRPLFDLLFHYTGQINQAFAKVFVATSSVAVILWSVAIIRTRRLEIWAGVFGCAVGGITLVMLLSGHLSLDVHGFGAVMFGQGTWLAIVGALMIRRGKLPSV